MKSPFYSNAVPAVSFCITIILGFVIQTNAQAQDTWHSSTKDEDRPLFTEHFGPEEFAERRAKVYDEIGENSIAVIQGAPSPMGYHHFRQYNEFYYLSGIESPDAYLILDGSNRTATIYLYNRKSGREYGEGKYFHLKMQS